MKSGIDGKQTVFLFSDNQIKEESFVEDINMILNTGDVPNIFAADEKADVIEKMQGVAKVEVILHFDSSSFILCEDMSLISCRFVILIDVLHWCGYLSRIFDI